MVVELLQQLLFWQERQKAQDPLKATKKKRLVSGLRSVAYHVHRAWIFCPMHFSFLLSVPQPFASGEGLSA